MQSIDHKGRHKVECSLSVTKKQCSDLLMHATMVELPLHHYLSSLTNRSRSSQNEANDFLGFSRHGLLGPYLGDDAKIYIATTAKIIEDTRTNSSSHHSHSLFFLRSRLQYTYHQANITCSLVELGCK